jgi:hypothetical protein
MPALLLSPVARWLASALAVLAIAGGLYACGQLEGRSGARVDSLERAIEAVETRREEDDRAARDPDPVERLRTEGWQRD